MTERKVPRHAPMPRPIEDPEILVTHKPLSVQERLVMVAGQMAEPDGTFKGLPVPGYRPQTGEAVKQVEENKRLEEVVLRRIEEIEGFGDDIDRRWLAIGRTQIEQGFMAINRAIFRPQRVALPDDGEQADG